MPRTGATQLDVPSPERGAVTSVFFVPPANQNIL